MTPGYTVPNKTKEFFMLDLEKNSKLPLWQIPEAIVYQNKPALSNPREWELIACCTNYTSRDTLNPRVYTMSTK